MIAKIKPAVWITLSVVILVVLASGALYFVLADQVKPLATITPLAPATSASPLPESLQTTTLSPSVNPSVTITTPAPTITKVSDTTIDGGNLWLFPVDDGETKLALSTEQGNRIQMGRLDLANPTQKIVWKTVASTADTGGEGIADHWHIYAHNAHWLSFSVTGANRSFLLKLDKNFNRLSLTNVANKDTVSTTELADLGIAMGGVGDPMAGLARPVTTNDMFLVSEPNGVAVSHMVPGVGAKIYRFDTDGQATGTVLLGGPDYNFNNGSSAEQTESGFSVFATETLNVVQQGAIKLLKASQAWQPLSVTTLLDEARINLAMSTGVRLPSGYWILTARAVSDAYPRGEMPPPAKPGQGLSDDSGAIVRYVFDANNTLINRTVIEETKSNRPHTILVGNQLITTWDGEGHVTLRIDEVN